MNKLKEKCQHCCFPTAHARQYQAATLGLTSGFGMGPGRALTLWPATFYYNSVNLILPMSATH